MLKLPVTISLLFGWQVAAEAVFTKVREAYMFFYVHEPAPSEARDQVIAVTQ